MADHDIGDCKDLAGLESDRQEDVEAIIKEIDEQVNARPEVKRIIMESITAHFIASRSDRGSQLPPPESLKIMSDFLAKDSENNKEIALRELEARERQEQHEAESETKSQDHFIWVSKLLHCSAVIVGIGVLIFSGYLILNGNQGLGEKIITHGLAFVAGMGVKKMIS